MAAASVPERVKIRLWGKASGRCEYDGCNEPLWLDSLTKAQFNVAYIAHIIADTPTGPRGDPVFSEQLKADINNLMLLCDKHHRLIDIEDVDGHPVARLQQMKRKHEDRIELLTSITSDKRSHVVLYGANIGEHTAPLSWRKAAEAMVPEFYPAEARAIELSLGNSSYQDHESEYWLIEREHLNRQFSQKVKGRLRKQDINHISLFALAPQPLLIELGRLFSDIPAVEVFQLHREPQDWKWQNDCNGSNYLLHKPTVRSGAASLNISLSGTIDDSRISSVLGNDASIWTLTIDKPDNDFLKSREQLFLFRQAMRHAFDEIKYMHGQNTRLHLFPCVPVAVAVEIGRVWMPKADLPLRIYDQNRKNGGFTAAFDIRDSEAGGQTNDGRTEAST